MNNTAAGFFIQEVSIFTGQALVTMAAEAGLTVWCAFPAPLFVSMVVARWAAGDADSGIVSQLVVVVQTVIAVFWSWPVTTNLTAFRITRTCIIFCTIVICWVFNSAVAETFHLRKLIGW